MKSLFFLKRRKDHGYSLIGIGTYLATCVFVMHLENKNNRVSYCVLCCFERSKKNVLFQLRVTEMYRWGEDLKNLRKEEIVPSCAGENCNFLCGKLRKSGSGLHWDYPMSELLIPILNAFVFFFAENNLSVLLVLGNTSYCSVLGEDFPFRKCLHLQLFLFNSTGGMVKTAAQILKAL